ncbi:MAG: MBOAT family protein [Chloroflexi bacterium]|nr:MBOAT family protein [Chloroflexota bacterium]
MIASLHFFLFFLLTLGVYYALPHRWRWLWLLIMSYVFYGSLSVKYTVVLFTMTLISYGLARLIEAQQDIEKKKLYLRLGIILSFVTLGIFKYTGFFLSSVNDVLDRLGANSHIPLPDIWFPIGISFFTLQIVSYIMDVYTEAAEAEPHLGKYALYVAFFPQLLIGPIERASHLLPQFTNKVTFDYQLLVEGLIRIGWGFWKKLVIADRLAIVVDRAFSDPSAFSADKLALATLLYSIQIYADFSAYCDIVIGMAHILGIKLTENFNHPYFATSPIDFWRRWHITLGNWLRDYIFRPLNFAARRNFTLWIQTRNVLLVFLFSGLWHGAAWTFIIWGILHGGYQAVELALQRRARNKKSKSKPAWWKTAFSISVTFGLVTFAWIFFRAESVNDAFYIIKTIFTWGNASAGGSLWDFTSAFERQVVFLLIMILLVIEIAQYLSKKPVWEFIHRTPLTARWTMCLILIYSVIVFGYYGEVDPTAFIYAGF